MGKLITVSNLTGKRSGSTIIAIATAVILSHWGFKKTLLVNYSENGDDKLEKYINEIDCLYSLDYINAMGIDNTKNLYTTVNADLNIIANFHIELNSKINNMDEIVNNYLHSVSKCYDYIIVDLSNRCCESLTSISDLNLSICNVDKYIFENIPAPDLKNVIHIINKVNPALLKDKDFLKIIETKFNNFHLVSEDIDIYYRTSISDSLYEYIVDSIKSNSEFTENILDLCFNIMNPNGTNECDIPSKPNFWDRIKIIQKKGIIYGK